MLTRRSRKRKLFWTLAVLSLLFLGSIALWPVWFPWVLRPAARAAGVSWQSYQRHGYTRAALHKVTGRFGSVQFQAEEARFFLPNRWLWRHWWGSPDLEPYVRLTNWRLEILPGDTNAAPSTNSVQAILDQIEAIRGGLRDWLPRAQFTNGLVVAPGWELRIPDVDWQDGVLRLTATAPGLGQKLALQGNFAARNQYSLATELHPLGIKAQFQLQRATAHWSLAGTADWRSNRVALASQWGADGLLPTTASLSAEHWRVPADVLALEGYREISGALDVGWATNRFTFKTRVGLAPQDTNALRTPSVAADLSGHGDLEGLTVDEFALAAPGGLGRLAAATRLRWSGLALERAAQLNLRLDLGQLALTNLAGRITGQMRLEPQGNQWPRIEFAMQGRDLLATDIAIPQLTLKGRWRWPRLVVETCQLDLPASSFFQAAAELDVAQQRVSHGHWQFAGGYLRHFLPQPIHYETLQATGRVSGPLRQPEHTGRIHLAGLTAPGLRPCEAQLTWQGTNLHLNTLEGQLTNQQAQLRWAGALQAKLADPLRIDLLLRALDWRQDGQALYHLAAPTHLRVEQRSGKSDLPAWQVAVDELTWLGPDREIRLAAESAWPQAGHLTGRVRQLRLDDFSGLFRLPVTNATVQTLEWSAGWDSGPLDLTLQFSGQMPGPEGAPVELHSRLKGDASGLMIESTKLAAKSIPALSIQGRVPLVIQPARAPDLVQFESGLPFDVQMTTAPTANLRRRMAGGELTLVRPALELRLQGKTSNLAGAVRLDLAAVEWLPPTNQAIVPIIRHLHLDARLREERLEVRELSLQWNDQPVQGSGVWPLGSQAWEQLLAQGTLPDWKQAQARLSIAGADLPQFIGPLATNFLAQGRFQLEAELAPGGRLRGQVQITNGVTAPLPALGVMRSLNAVLHLADRQVRLDRLTGRLAGAPVVVNGQADLSDRRRPQLAVALRGTNVPLVRKPGIVVRSDLDLQLTAGSNQPPTLAGQVTMRDSLYLQKLELLAPRPDSGSEQRFPYFQVASGAVKDWKLNVRIAGDQFMRVRTPLFTGVASVDFKLQGNLGDPLALGEARINSGRLTFPFGRLGVTSGFVTVNSDAPHRPRLALNASGSRYGYEIKMNVSGPADDPQVILTSSPPLNSGQILLLLTAGELPNRPGHFSQQSRAQSLAVFLGKDLLSRVTGSESSKERLIVNSGERISEGGRSTYVIEYRLTDDWSLVGEYDRFDTLNAYIKWRFYKK